jgi:hypothetical protein
MVEFENYEIFAWKLNRYDIAYNYQDGQEYYQKGNTKYKGDRNDLTFTLTVKNLNFSDAGEYLCGAMDDTAVSYMTVLGKLLYIDLSIRFHCGEL